MFTYLPRYMGAYLSLALLQSSMVKEKDPNWKYIIYQYTQLRKADKVQMGKNGRERTRHNINNFCQDLQNCAFDPL